MLKNKALQQIIERSISKFIEVAIKNSITKEDLYMFSIELLWDLFKNKEEITDKDIFYFRNVLALRLRSYANQDIRVRKNGEEVYIKLTPAVNPEMTQDGEYIDSMDTATEENNLLGTKNYQYSETQYREALDNTDCLSDSQREILETYLRNNCSVKHTAKELGKSYQNVDVQVKRIIYKIKKSYKEKPAYTSTYLRMLEDYKKITIFLEVLKEKEDNLQEYMDYVNAFVAINSEKEFFEEILLNKLNIYKNKLNFKEAIMLESALYGYLTHVENYEYKFKDKSNKSSYTKEYNQKSKKREECGHACSSVSVFKDGELVGEYVPSANAIHNITQSTKYKTIDTNGIAISEAV